jgi:pimeloyl-ACP methyl ester carboxylesterase
MLHSKSIFPALLTLGLLGSCASPDAFVRDRVTSGVMAPPNGGRAQVSPRIAEFNPLQYDAAYTVDVGPPDATLAYWVTNPTPERLGMLRPPEWVADRCVHTSDPPRGVAIVLSGWTRQSNRDGAYMPRILTTLLCQGWRMVVPDLRGFGESTGQVASYGIYDSQDLRQLLDDLHARGLLTEPVIVLGHSYGALVALQFAAKDRRVSALLAFSGPKDLRSIVPAVRSTAGIENPLINAVLGDRLSDDLVRSAIEEASIRNGVDPSKADGVAAARILKIPYLVAHGRADNVVPVSDAEALAAANPTRSTLWIGPADDHNSYFNNSDFVRYVFEWLYALPRLYRK